MSRSTPTEVLVAVHFDPEHGRARHVSIDGEHARATWIAKSLTSSFHLTGKTTRGIGRDGRQLTLPLAHLTIPEWLAKDRGFV